MKVVCIDFIIEGKNNKKIQKELKKEIIKVLKNLKKVKLINRYCEEAITIWEKQ